MKTVKLGTSDLWVSPLTVGCWSFGGDKESYWGQQDQETVNRLVDRALREGVNFFDTAFGYNDGRSEKSLGQALKGKRNQAIICNKIPIQTEEALPHYARTIEGSLERLQTDFIDVMMIHWPTKDEKLLKANLRALQAEKTRGTIRHIGVSNFGVQTLKIAADLGIKVVANEFAYNLITRGMEKEILPYCRQHSIGVAAYMPLMQGILAGKFASIADIPGVRRRTVHFSSQSNPLARHGGPGVENELAQFLQKLQQISRETGYHQAHLAIAWLMAREGVTTVIAGCRDEGQLQTNAAAVEAKLSPDILEALTEASRPLFEKLPHQVDLWQLGDNVRIY